MIKTDLVRRGCYYIFNINYTVVRLILQYRVIGPNNYEKVMHVTKKNKAKRKGRCYS